MSITKQGEGHMTYKYIPVIPKPLLEDFIRNRVVPFVGAGFSKNAMIPDGLTMPDWNELGKLAADNINDYEYNNNPIDALSYFEVLYSRTKLVEFLMRAVHVGEIRPGETYKAFCDLFTGTICTTNYDSLLEDEMGLLQRPVSIIVTEDRLTVNTPDENRILKLHGDFNHPHKMVITEHDYDMYLEKNPVFATYVSNLFISNTMLLIGYSLDDNDFRGIWHIINDRLGGMTQPAYCVVVDASQAEIARYTRRNIHVINLPGKKKDYKTILRDFFVEIKEYISAEKDKTVKSKDERINEQLIIPSDNNRLCFISCSMKRIAQLSELLYPILRSNGIMPVRIDDVLMPGDNWIDVAETIIRKSKMAIVDISDKSQNVLFELGYLNAEQKSTLVICEDNVDIDIPSILKNKLIFKYSMNYTEKEYTAFEKQITRWIENSVEVITDKKRTKDSSLFEDAERLLQKKEYSACIISAYSVFEMLIRKNNPSCSFSNNWFSMIDKNELISKSEKDSLRKIRQTRNAIVHGMHKATEDEAAFTLDILTTIYNHYLR